MPNRLQAGQALLRGVDAAERRKFRKILTGRLLDDGFTVTLAGAPTNKCWVRYPYDSREQTAVWGQVAGINLPLYVGPSLDGGDEIKAIAWATGTVTVGGALIALSQPPFVGDVAGASVTGLNFTPGRVEASQLAYPYVHVNAFWYDDGYWDDGALSGAPTLNDFNLAPYITAPTGYSQWIVFYFDPDAGALRATANTPVFGGVNVLNEAQINTSAIPAGMYPLGAAKVAFGQTAWAATDFDNMRIFLAKVHADWLVIYDDTIIPAGVTMVQAHGVRVEATLTVNGSLVIV